jgi:hypothetical protein
VINNAPTLLKLLGFEKSLVSAEIFLHMSDVGGCEGFFLKHLLQDHLVAFQSKIPASFINPKPYLPFASLFKN